MADVSLPTIYAIAATASCDPTTVKRYLDGRPVRGAMLRDRLAGACRVHRVQLPQPRAMGMIADTGAGPAMGLPTVPDDDPEAE